MDTTSSGVGRTESALPTSTMAASSSVAAPTFDHRQLHHMSTTLELLVTSMARFEDRLNEVDNRTAMHRPPPLPEPEPPSGLPSHWFSHHQDQPPFASFDSSVQQPQQPEHMEWQHPPTQHSWELRPPDPSLPYGVPQYSSAAYLPPTPYHQQGDQDWQPSLHPYTHPSNAHHAPPAYPPPPIPRPSSSWYPQGPHLTQPPQPTSYSNSCWDPPGVHLTQPLYQPPRPPSCWDPPAPAFEQPPYQTSEYHNCQLESQPPLLQNQYAHDPHIAPHSGWYQQPHHSHLNIDEQTLDPYYRLEAYQQRADDQLSTQPPYTGFDLPEPPLYRATEPLGMPRDPVTPTLEQNLQLVALVSQLERLTTTVEQLVSQMDANKRFLGDPHSTMRPTSHLRTAAPLAAAAAVSSMNLPPPAPPCSRDISGDEGELLDDDPLPLAVISQSVDPNTSPTSVPHFVLVVFPGSIKMGISKGVKRDYSSSSLGKRMVTEKFHNLDDIGFNDEANPINGDVARMNHRPPSLDGDTRLIRPRKDTSCLSILGRVDKLPVLTLNFGNHNGHPLMIFDGGDEGRCSTVRCAFDPGGDT